MSHTLALLTVVYQNYEVLQDFFKSLHEQTDMNFHLFIADASDEKKSITKPNFSITVIDVENKGYAHGINIGTNEALKQNFDYVAAINNDTYFKKDFIGNTIRSLHTHPHTIIGGKIYYAPGYEYHATRYDKEDRGHVLWYAGGSTDWNHVTTHHRGVDEIDKGQYDKAEQTGFVTGCFMAYDRYVIDQVGQWDNSYFLYYEDADFCERAIRKDIPLLYDPTIHLWHKSGQSTQGAASAFQQKYMEKNRLKFGLKYAPLRTKLHLIKNTMFGA